MSKITMTVELEGFKELRQKLRDPQNEVWGRPWTRSLEKATDLVETEIKRRAPRRTGKLLGAVKHKMQARPVPLWARISANRTRKGFRYGWALNYSQKHPYHYRSGPRRGQRTLHWLTGALLEMQPQVNALLEQAADEIERDWGR